MTRSGLAALALAATVVRCVLPPPVAVEQAQNHAPFILDDQVKPAAGDVTLDLYCGACTFTVAADDPDPTDTLHARWFIDYDHGGTAGINGCDLDSPPPTADQPNRPAFTCKMPLQSLGPLTQTTNDQPSDVHVVEVVIADQGFASATDRTLPDGALRATYRWTVTARYEQLTCSNESGVCAAKTSP